MEYLIKKLKKEDGVTLVELLAAIAILSIIVTAFLAFFTQAGRTNNMTDDMNEATFIAVEEMERITNLSQQSKTFDKMKTFYNNDEHYNIVEDELSLKITRVYDTFSTSLIIDKPENEETLPANLYRAKVTVKEGGRTHAEMQSVLPFEE